MQEVDGALKYEVLVDGTAVPETILDQVIDIVVDQQRRLPDRAIVRLSDATFAIAAEQLFTIGRTLQVAFRGATVGPPVAVFDGQITSIECDFAVTESTALVICAHDRGHALARTTRSAAYTMSYGDIAAKLATDNGLTAGTIESGRTPATVQQFDESDWDFLWRLADEVGYAVKVAGKKLSFGPFAIATGAAVDVEFGVELLSFRPRATGMRQLSAVTVRGWDPGQTASVSADATPTTTTTIGVARDAAISALGAGQLVIPRAAADSDGVAQELADGAAARMATSFVDAEGVVVGNPELRAGSTLTVTEAGPLFSGDYAVTGARHVMRSADGYRTEFFVEGDGPPTLTSLSVPPALAAGVRLIPAIVTGTADADGLGRVRVRYPLLDDDQDGWWARVVTLGAGADRGLVALPKVGDEVLVALDPADDTHPFVLGGLYSAQQKPTTLIPADAPDESFHLASDKKVTLTSKQAVSMNTPDTLTLTAAGTATLTTDTDGEGAPGDVVLTAKGALRTSGKTGAEMKTDSAGVSIDGSGSLTLEGTTITIDGKGGVTISSDGMVKISGTQVVLG